MLKNEEKYSTFCDSCTIPETTSNIYKASLNYSSHVQHVKEDKKYLDLPKNYNLRKYKTVSNVIDQGECGSCWAISTISAIANLCEIEGFGNFNFSYKHSMNCQSKNPCEGGNPAQLLKYLESQPAVDSCTVSGCSCRNFGYLKTVKIKKNSIKLVSDIHTIKEYIFLHGPLIAGLLIYENFKHGNFGNHGIYLDSVKEYVNGSPIFESPSHLMGAHSVVVVGFGEEDHIETSPKKFETVSYWICRNSWGSNWGDGGFFKIATHKFNKIVQLEKLYLNRGFECGGMLTFDIETPQKNLYLDILTPSIIILILSIIIIYYYWYKK